MQKTARNSKKQQETEDCISLLFAVFCCLLPYFANLKPEIGRGQVQNLPLPET